MTDHSHRNYEPDAAAAYWAEERADPTDGPCSQTSSPRETKKRESQLTALVGLASVNIETSLVSDLSGSLHSLFDDVCDKTLPIYFGPLLGRLYLEGL